MTKQQAPRTIKVGPWQYKLTFAQAVIDRYRVLWESSNLGGGIDYRECLIFVDPEGAPSQQREILWHECTHAALRLSDNHDEEKELKSEQFTSLSAKATLMIMRDNPALVRYLLAP